MGSKLRCVRVLLYGFVLLFFCSMLGDFGDEMDQTSSRMDSVLKKLEKVSHMTSSKCTPCRLYSCGVAGCLKRADECVDIIPHHNIWNS